MKKELIKFMEDQDVLGYRLDGPSEQIVRESIDQFFDQYQPERSKREDSCEYCKNSYKSGVIMCNDHGKELIKNMRCGALNSMET